MKNLLFKEFKLDWHPSIYIFLICGALVLIPSWIYFLAFGYIIMGIMTQFFTSRANQDVFFSVSLPVRKRDAVRARVLAVAALELLQIVSAVPFAILSNIINPTGNHTFMNINFAFFGCVFILYAIFNIIFLPLHYRTAYKVGVPALAAIFAALLFGTAIEFAVHCVPFLNTNINAFGAGHFIFQLPVLIIGMVIFVLFTCSASKQAEKRFEKIDL